MPITILIPTPLRRFVQGKKTVEVDAETVQGALGSLADQNPELRKHLFDAQGNLLRYVNVFLGDANVRDLAPVGTPVPVRPGDVLSLIVAIAGGAPKAPSGPAIK